MTSGTHTCMGLSKLTQGRQNCTVSALCNNMCDNQLQQGMHINNVKTHALTPKQSACTTTHLPSALPRCQPLRPGARGPRGRRQAHAAARVWARHRRRLAIRAQLRRQRRRRVLKQLQPPPHTQLRQTACLRNVYSLGTQPPSCPVEPCKLAAPHSCIAAPHTHLRGALFVKMGFRYAFPTHAHISAKLVLSIKIHYFSWQVHWEAHIQHNERQDGAQVDGAANGWNEPAEQVQVRVAQRPAIHTPK